MVLSSHRDEGEAPTVSIGMPVFNGERFIREALELALRQTFSDFEIIIADNNSDDATQAICREYMARDPRIKYIRHEKNYGATWNFTFVSKQARGKFFTWLAHDDFLEPQFLERTVQYMSLRPGTVLVASDFSIVDESGTEQRIETLDEFRDSINWKIRQIPFFEFGYAKLHLCIYGLMQTKICKPLMAQMKIPKMLYGSEYPILARFAVRGEVASLPFVLRKYRSHDSGQYFSEVKANEKKTKARRVAFFYSNLFKMRIDLFLVLLGSTLPWKAKSTILRRHAVMDWQWYRYKITGQWIPRKTITELVADGNSPMTLSIPDGDGETH